MFNNRNSPWDKIGKNVNNNKTVNSVDELLKISDLDWEVLQEDIYTENRNRIKNYKVNIRKDTGDVLGIVTDFYKVIQNNEAFYFLGDLINYGFEIEKAGFFGVGEGIWVIGKLQEQIIIEDSVCPYIAFTSRHDGKGAVRGAILPLRIICMNVLNFDAGKNSNRHWYIRHTGDVKDKLHEAEKSLKMTHDYMNWVKDKAQELYEQNLSMNDISSIVKKLFPINTDDENLTKRKMSSIIDKRRELVYRLENAPDLDGIRWTKWGFLSAVSDYATHTSPLRKTQNYDENLFLKVLKGHDLIDKAYKLVA